MICRVLVLLSLLGAPAVNGISSVFRLAGGQSRCQGELQIEMGTWTDMSIFSVPKWLGQKVCEALDCGAALAAKLKKVPRRDAIPLKTSGCEDVPLSYCFHPDKISSDVGLEVKCSDSVRLVEGWKQGHCSGSVEIDYQSSAQSWTPVCEGALDRRGAEVLCRELGCGAPVLQGALSPLEQTFHCEGHESALLDCPRDQPKTEACYYQRLTCSEVRLVGGASRCEGTLEVSVNADWKRAQPLIKPFPLEAAAVVCWGLGCGLAVSAERREFNHSDTWVLSSDCENWISPVKDCVLSGSTYSQDGVDVVCSGGSPTTQTQILILVSVCVVLITAAIV